MRRRAAIDSSFQLCLWDELLEQATDEMGGGVAGGGIAAAPPISAGQAPIIDRRPARLPRHRPDAPGEEAR